MEIQLQDAPEIILQNPRSLHNYFAWPSAARLKNGKIAVGCSGFRLAHVCPFGKAVLTLSEDDGKTFSPPMAVIDTVLDDRDAGLCPFGTTGLIVTSFNNSVEFQRNHPYYNPYSGAYLDKVTAEMQDAVLGTTFRVSFDNGVTFGPLCRSPITSPHGPLELQDGRILWVGRTYTSADRVEEVDEIRAYLLNPADGSMEFIGKIANIYDGQGRLLSCEPDTLQLPDGRLICHIRVQRKDPKVFTLYQSESADFGKTWTVPRQIIDTNEGAPAHLLLHSSGVLMSVYGHRQNPCGIRVIFSEDMGKTWSQPHVLYDNGDVLTWDLGYPATVECADGSLLTVFYAHETKEKPAVIFKQKWSFR